MEFVLRINLFGHPAIYLNGEEIFFSFSKINALLYYLLVNGAVSRDEVAGILWENKDNQTAKKNLRNTIYQANKLLGQDVIISPNRSILSLNPILKIESDLQSFAENPLKNLSLYQGDFLKGFYLKDSEMFDFWIVKMRLHYEQVYVKACYEQFEGSANQGDFEETERHLLRLIAMDEFEEKNYQLLMKLYQEHHRSSKVIETYYKLVNLLDKELGISPSEDIQQIYHEVLAKDRNERKTKQFLRNTNHFYGRVDEIRQLEEYFSKVLEEQGVRSLVLVGGTGLGKRTVTRQVLANQTKYFQIVMAECYREESELPLQPWRTILDGLGDLVIQHKILSISQWNDLIDYHMRTLNPNREISHHEMSRISQFIVDILQKVSREKALVVLIEDCHWMDRKSLLLLQNSINHLADFPIAFILTKHVSTSEPLEYFLNHLTTYHQLDYIELKPLDEKESLEFVKSQLGNHPISPVVFQEMFHVSQGVPFFLEEYAQAFLKNEKFTPLTAAIKAKLSLKVHSSSASEEEILYYISCFKERLSLDLLGRLLLLSREEVMKMVDTLVDRVMLIKEEEGEQVYVSFSQLILKIYCYESLSLSKKRLFHLHIAQEMEREIEEGRLSLEAFEEIAYHYHLAKQTVKSLEYQLHYLNERLQFQHELFPIYSRKMGRTEEVEDEGYLVHDRFDNIAQEMMELEVIYGKNREFQLLRLRFLYLQGRYHICMGDYEKGIHQIQEVISMARQWHEMEFLLEGYRQLIYYCIQTENIPEMRYYTELALDAAVEANNHEAIAIHLRLRGLYYMMVADEEQALHLIHQSIDCFSLTTSLRERYAIQIAAALDYLAEIGQINGNFETAITYQKEALQLAEGSVFESSVIVFYIGLGISYYLLGASEQAEKIFMKAKASLEHLSFPWKEVQLEVYLALIACEKGDFQPVLALIDKKEHLISRYSSPRDKGMIYYLLAVLKGRLLKGELAATYFGEVLNQSYLTYYEVAKAHLNPYRDRYRLQELEELKLSLILSSVV